MRARERAAFASGGEMPTVNDVSDPWTMSKDGRRFWPRDKVKPEWMRK